MRKRFLVSWGVIVFFGLLFLSPLQAGAISLLSEDFSEAIIEDYLTIDFTDNAASLHKWIDVYYDNDPGWEIVNESAQHSEGRNFLIYGIDLTGKAARRYRLEFDYVASDSKPLFGMRVIAKDQEDEAWYPVEDPDDQEVFLLEKLDKTSGWLHAKFQGYIPFDYDILQLGISGIGADDGLRGLDNVKLTAVPEPATLLLLGSGLLGLVGFSRKKIFKK